MPGGGAAGCVKVIVTGREIGQVGGGLAAVVGGSRPDHPGAVARRAGGRVAGADDVGVEQREQLVKVRVEFCPHGGGRLIFVLHSGSFPAFRPYSHDMVRVDEALRRDPFDQRGVLIGVDPAVVSDAGVQRQRGAAACVVDETGHALAFLAADAPVLGAVERPDGRILQRERQPLDGRAAHGREAGEALVTAAAPQPRLGAAHRQAGQADAGGVDLKIII